METDPAPIDADSDTCPRMAVPVVAAVAQACGFHVERTRSRHTTVGRYYMQRALLILFEPGDAGTERVPREPEFGYFLTPDSRPSWLTILTELGRIPDDETLRTVARRVAQERPPTQKAAALIRRHRADEPGPRTRRLEERLLAAIDEHCARHPATSPTDIQAALSTAADVVRPARLSPAGEDAAT